MEGKKQRIIEEAVFKFSEKGYSETTMAEIAREASVGKGTIYNYFEDKRDLNDSVLRYGIDVLANRIKANINENNPTREVLEAIIDCYLQFYEENYDLARVLLRELWGHKTKFEEKMKTIRHNHTALIEEVIERGVERGELRDINVSTAAVSLVGIIHASVLNCMMFRCEFPRQVIKNDIEKIYFRGVLA